MLVEDYERPAFSEPTNFDFAPYLSGLPSGDCNWSIQVLSGGHANHTVRATRMSDLDHLGNIRNVKEDDIKPRSSTHIYHKHQSIVLKQAPPYFVKFPDMKFSQRRQTIEAKALELLHTSPEEHRFGLLHILKANPAIQVARLIHHDTLNHVLIQSDLGSHPTLDIFLCAPSTKSQLASRVGHSIGYFLASLHNALDLESCVSPEDVELIETLNSDGADSVWPGILNVVQDYMKDALVSDYEILGQRARDNWNSRKKVAFSQGDIWFGTILVEQVDGTNEFKTPVIGICDWEFAGPHHPAGDIAQLGSYLNLLTLSPLVTPHTRTVVDSFSTSLYSTYFSSTKHLPQGDVKNPNAMQMHSEFQRSLLIMHGWELINAAAWRHDLWCSCPGTGVKCPHIVHMVREGALLIRAAGAIVEDVDWKMLDDVAWVKFLRVAPESE